MTLLEQLGDEKAAYAMRCGRIPDTVTMHQDTARALAEELAGLRKYPSGQSLLCSNYIGLNIICPIGDGTIKPGVFELSNGPESPRAEELIPRSQARAEVKILQETIKMIVDKLIDEVRDR